MPPPILVGALAQRLVDAQVDRLAAEDAVDDLLVSLFDDYRPRFPRHLGWLFVAPAGLSVWGVIKSPAALATLAMAGFLEVKLHPYPAGRPINCDCPTRRPT